MTLVCLVGLRGAGKTTVGELVAERSGWRFVDLDEELAARWADESGRDPLPAGGILAQIGEKEFRDLEARTLEALAAESRARDTLVATGGGCVETARCRALLSSARTFWLVAEPERLVARIERDPTPRPALTKDADPLAEMRAIGQRRAAWYAEVAEAKIDASGSIDSIADELIRRLES